MLAEHEIRADFDRESRVASSRVCHANQFASSAAFSLASSSLLALSSWYFFISFSLADLAAFEVASRRCSMSSLVCFRSASR